MVIFNQFICGFLATKVVFSCEANCGHLAAVSAPAAKTDVQARNWLKILQVH
jgi:hypothetical protein